MVLTTNNDKAGESSMTTIQATDSYQMHNQKFSCLPPQNQSKGLDSHNSKLMQAVFNDDLEQVKDLLQTNGSVNFTSNSTDFSGHSWGNYTPIVIAASRGNKAIVQILLEANADPLKGSYYGKNALEWAEELHHNEIADMLNQANKNRRKQEFAISHLFFGCAELLVASVISFEVIARLDCKFYGSDFLFPCKDMPRSYLASTLVGLGGMSIVAYKSFSYAINEFKLMFQKS